MRTTSLTISGAAVIDAEPFTDRRGVFSRWFCSHELADLIGVRQIVNVNFSRTEKTGSIRGMHFQYSPMAEMKLIRCLRGKVFDVVVDLRKDSSTFLQWHGEILSVENMRMMILPEGVAHGFQALEDRSEMLYLHTEFYSKGHDAGIRYDDPLVGIDWPVPVTDVSEKDQRHLLLKKDFEGIVV
jgi:dTDP-4-dehydrorhamnose 3,5-epimerase